jgi:hypothetical protein
MPEIKLERECGTTAWKYEGTDDDATELLEALEEHSDFRRSVVAMGGHITITVTTP